MNLTLGPEQDVKLLTHLMGSGSLVGSFISEVKDAEKIQDLHCKLLAISNMLKRLFCWAKLIIFN